MVSSRSKAAAEAAANKRTTRSAAGAAGGLKPLSAADPENISAKKVAGSSTKPMAKKSVFKPVSVSVSSVSTAAKGWGRKRKGGTYCNCEGQDDGTPMIKCEGECKNWYHFRCVNLSEDVAEEIERYYCPECEANTGLKTVSKLDFEGPDALLEISASPPPEGKRAPMSRKRTPAVEAEIESAEESEDNSTEDEYMGESMQNKSKAGKRITHRFPFSDKSASASESEDDSDVEHQKRASRSGGRLKRLKKATSPSPSQGPSSVSKRRGSSAQQPTTKRSKTAEFAQDDALRRYCLTKLEEIIRPMFEEYQDVQEAPESEVKGDAGDENKDDSIKDLVDDRVNAIDQKVKSFVAELEQCMMETYAEHDKSGRPSAAGKYKERFRMLQFNLSKSDRIILRKGIATGRIVPAQLNVMSSTDLADEQRKHEIELAEKEALEHSILQKITAPRAKMTHKGIEAIEDESGQRADAAKEEEEERRMEIEKREREKLARVRTVTQQEGSPATPVDAAPLSAGLPNSPTTANATRSQQSWGAPPPLPLHAQHDSSESTSGSPLSTRPPVRPLFIPSASEYTSVEQSLSLADLINIDDEISTQEAPQSTPQQRMSAQLNADSATSSSPVITMPSGPSPFAPSKSAESPSRVSFDLNSLWTGNDKLVDSETPHDDRDPSSTAIAENPADKNSEENQDDAMELESINEYDDQALDAILEKADREIDAPSPKEEKQDIDTLPKVWEGQLCMPLDAVNSLISEVTCSQIGGRKLEPLSGFWQTLFPTSQARIDGRVPVNTSSQYLVTTRLKPMKELIAVCFTPVSETSAVKFNELSDFLVGKDRHALVFPWGVHPNPQAPGRELYLIPLLKDSPIPEFIELLDELVLPRERKANTMLGVFVLNKGRLSASTPPPPPPVPSGLGPFNTTAPSLPVIPGVSSHNIFPNMQPTPSTSAPSKPFGPPVKIDQATLAAEVASLTPEQISLMLRHLSRSAPLAATTAATMPSAISPPLAPGPPGPSHAFSASPVPAIPPFPAQYQAPYQSHMQSPPQQFSPPHPPAPGYGEYDYDDRNHQGQPYGREERGRRGGRGRGSERGRRGGRGRGRAFNGERDARAREPDHRTADQGWSGRGRGGGLAGSPPQERRSRFAAN